ncbi:MAG: KH domain-containing protein [Ruminococcaceae bacterium]|nr:KH domain-containing protein [Oscillospiraceae bacterium]
MKEFLEIIAKQLVNNPDQVVVEVEETEDRILLKLSVAEEDKGRVIGREGKIAKSLRTIVKAVARNQDKPVFVDIL